MTRMGVLFRDPNANAYQPHTHADRMRMD